MPTFAFDGELNARTAGLSEAADDAARELPDEVEYQQAEEYLGRHGITKDELISRTGGSP
jgi:hypothetical protein